MDNFIRLFAEAIELDNTSILSPDTKFRELDVWNSLAGLSLISMLDDEYDIQIETPELKKLITLGDLFNYIQQHK